MNILTAPLINLIDFSSMSLSLDEKNGGKVEGSYLKGGTLICLLIIVAGIYFVSGGTAGAAELETPLGKIKTGSAGIVLIFIGSSLYLLIGKVLMGRGGKD